MNRPLWWDVPMPPAVAALPRTKSGMPVVFITDYKTPGLSEEEHTTIVDIQPGLGKHDCLCEFGNGSPMIGSQCPRRQADAMLKRLCGVCGTKINPGTEMVFVGAKVEETEPSRQMVYTSIEAGVHPDCATYSMLTCPRLKDRQDLKVVVARDFLLYGRIHTDPNDITNVTVARIDDYPPMPGRGVLSLYVAVIPPHTSKLFTLPEWHAQARPLDRPSLNAVMPEPRG